MILLLIYSIRAHLQQEQSTRLIEHAVAFNSSRNFFQKITKMKKLIVDITTEPSTARE